MKRLTRRAAVKFLALMSLASPIDASAADPTPVSIALDWTPNTNHIGLYVAQQKGFFSEAGLKVTILPYSDTAAGTLVSNGRADFGVAGVGFYAQRTAGADLKAVYAVVQHETGRLIVEADRTEIKTPKDLNGLTYGGFGSAWENALVASMIRNAGGAGTFKTVTLGTSAYEALANHSVDFTLEIETWEGVEAQLAGEKLKTFKYSDFGVPDQQTTLIVSSDAYLAKSPRTATAFIGAVQKGYAYAVDHPDEAAKILIDANPDALTKPDLVRASLKALVDGHYLRSENGAMGLIDPAKNEAIGQYMIQSRILVDADGLVITKAPDFATFISNDYLPKP